MSRARRLLAGLCGGAGLAIILAVVVLCLPLTVPRLLGYDVFSIVSGSMEPALPVGSLVYAKGTEPQAVRPGDVIVFYSSGEDESSVTHRVVENQADERQFVTKGDANEGADLSPVPYERLIGVVAFSLPALGLFLPAVSTMAGKLSLLGVLLAAVLLRVVAGRIRREAEED